LHLVGFSMWIILRCTDLRTSSLAIILMRLNQGFVVPLTVKWMRDKTKTDVTEVSGTRGYQFIVSLVKPTYFPVTAWHSLFPEIVVFCHCINLWWRVLQTSFQRGLALCLPVTSSLWDLNIVFGIFSKPQPIFVLPFVRRNKSATHAATNHKSSYRLVLLFSGF
jgi:hypothetical protein